MAGAISSGWATRPSGICGRNMSSICLFCVSADANLVSVRPGSTAFTRTFHGAHSLAKDLVMLMTAPLVIE